MKNDKVAEPITQQREELSRNTDQHEIDFEGINDEALGRFDDVIEWLRSLKGNTKADRYRSSEPEERRLRAQFLQDQQPDSGNGRTLLSKMRPALI